MVVEKQKLDNKVKEMKDRLQVRRTCSSSDLDFDPRFFTFLDSKNLQINPQIADQNIKNVEDLQDEYDFKMNTLKNRGGEGLVKATFHICGIFPFYFHPITSNVRLVF